MTKRLLLTGGFGYLGGRIARTLVAEGFDVLVGTRRRDALPPVWLPHVRPVHLDWQDDSSLRLACTGVSAVIHLAAMNEIDSAKDAVAALHANGVNSLRLLDASIAETVTKFVYFSTAHVYGAPLRGNIDEQSVPRPQNPYAITHKVAEDFVLASHDKRDVHGLVFRLSNGFGAPATHEVNRWTLLVNDLCRQAAVSGAIRLHTAGTQLRDFITLEDVARAVVHGLHLDQDSLGDGLFNLGKGSALSIFDMAMIVAGRWKAVTGNELPISRPEPVNSEVEPLIYSCEKFRRTGFSLVDRVSEEIDATIRLTLSAFGR